MIVPLFFEQLLVMLVGMADTLVVSYVGEAAVSGVSLVNQFNTIFIYLFTALASGGAVVISQYIGRGDKCSAGTCASQLLSFSTLFSVATAAVLLIGNEWILGLMFGRIESSVMDACVTYMRISAYSYPALAVYNVGAALQRSMGRTNVTMYVSMASNAINVIGNLIGVFVVHAGVAGVAYPSLAARAFSAALITWMCFRGGNGVCYSWREIFSIKAGYMKRILKIAVPNGLENGVFQLVKVALSGIVALFGTCQIAANGVAQSIWSMAALMGVTMGAVFITVIGQCIVIYFSCTDNTKRIAGYVAESAGADIYRIKAATPYTSEDLDYGNDDSRTSKEQNDDSARPKISGSLPNLKNYDVIYLGYPIWWERHQK